MYCKNCGAQINDGIPYCNFCGAPQPVHAQQPPVGNVSSGQGMNFDFNTNTASAATMKRYQYKVLSQKDRWFTGKFDPALLEQALNAYAQQGWRVIGCATADIAGFGTSRQEFITLLEREV